MDEPHAKPPSGARERRLGRTIHGRTAVNQEGKKSEGSKKESTGFVSTRFDRRREKEYLPFSLARKIASLMNF